jgi:hypothetical protein
MWIEIFKSGSRTDSSGITRNYSLDMLDAMASIYNQKVAANPSFQAPVVKGHPKTDDPAVGWVERLYRRGNTLCARLRDLQPEFVEEVNSQKFRHVSVALYPNMMLRHVGFLGAAPPAVQGLRNVKFNDKTGFNEYLYSESEAGETDYPIGVAFPPAHVPSSMPGAKSATNLKKLEKKNSELASLNSKYLQKISLLEKEARLKDFRQFANSLVDNPKGSIITPAQVDTLVDLMESAYCADLRPATDSTDSSFSQPAGQSSLDRIKEFMSGLKPVFSLEEFAPAPPRQDAPGNIDPTPDFSEVNVIADRLSLHNKALELVANSPGLSYEEAVCQAERLKF